MSESERPSDEKVTRPEVQPPPPREPWEPPDFGDPSIRFVVEAMTTGVLGSMATAAAKAAVERIVHRDPRFEDNENHGEAWEKAREAILERHGGRLADRDDRLALAPHEEIIGSDGRWDLFFSTEKGMHFQVVLGPSLRVGGWRLGVRTVSRISRRS